MTPAPGRYAILLSFLAALPLLALISSCNPENYSGDEEIEDIQVLLNQAANQSAQDAKIAQVYFIDSAVAGKKLTVSQQVQVFEYKAGVYTNQVGDYDRANQVADSMLALVESVGPEEHKNEYARANYSKGDILFLQKKYNEAYKHYYRARLVGKTLMDSCTLGEYSFRLAFILYRQARFPEAANKFRQSFAEGQTCKFDFPRYYRLQQVLNNIGLSYYKAGNTDSGLYYYQQGLDYIARHRYRFKDRQYMNEVARAVIIGNLADIYKLKGDLDRAKALLKESIAINSLKGYDNADAQYSQVKLAEIYGEQGDTDSMHAVLLSLKKGLDTVPNPRAEMDWNRLMWKYHNENGNIARAYAHLKQFTASRDQQENDASQLKSADLSQQIRMLEDQFEIQALQKNNELKNVYLWIFILAFVLAAVIVFFSVRNLTRSRKNVQLLQALNTQVTEQKHQLQDAVISGEEKSRQQERILRAVAHDLRGPMATISMLCDLIMNEKDPAAREEMVGFIKTSCKNSLDLVAEILEAADLARKKEQEKEPTNINHLIRDTVSLMQLKAAEKDQLISTDVPEKDHYVHLNPEKIRRVLVNIITNAIKFSPKGAPIRVAFEVRQETNLISVEDHGIGIPPAIQPRVFDMFTEAKRKGTNGELPYGLGLSICKQIVDAHNGDIWLESEEDRGTTFYVALP